MTMFFVVIYYSFYFLFLLFDKDKRFFIFTNKENGNDIKNHLNLAPSLFSFRV